MKKIILITGATDGIGLATAQQLVTHGHQVLLHGRNPSKLEQARQQLLSIDSNALIKTYLADFADLKNVEEVSNKIGNENSRIDVIINNAGIFKTNQPVTQEKLDTRFVVNTLAPYLLTQRLLSVLPSSGRIINVASAAQTEVDTNALNGKSAIEDEFQAYAQSKLALIMWTNHLASNSNSDSPQFISINPGSLLATKMVKEGFGLAGKDISQGADILVHFALSDEFSAASGKYFDNDIGKFNRPHIDALDSEKNHHITCMIEHVIARILN